MAFERSTFPSIVDWAFAVLGVSVTEHTLTCVQRCYRALMKKLHPDKAAQSPLVISAVEMIQEAKAICERSLCRHEVPGAPRNLTVAAHCLRGGERRFMLRWTAPERQEKGPVQRYIVAVADPTGTSRSPIRLSTLEPDYSQELGRYVTLEELGCFELAEEEFASRVPALFQQRSLTLMVASSNKVGQSCWAAVTVDLTVSINELLPRMCYSAYSLQDASRATSPPAQSSRSPRPRTLSPGSPRCASPQMMHCGGPTVSPTGSPVVRRSSPPSPASPCISTPQAHGICAPRRVTAAAPWMAAASGSPWSVIRFRNQV